MSSVVSAQRIEVTLSGSDTIVQGDVLQLSISFENLASNESFELPEMVGLVVVGRPSSQTQMSIVNGVRSSLRAYVYPVVADQVGLAFIPAVSIDHNGEIVTSQAISRFIEEDPNYIPVEDRELEESGTEAPRRKRRPTIRM